MAMEHDPSRKRSQLQLGNPIDISDERLLHLDPEGGLHLNLSIGNTLQAKPDAAPPQQVTEKWVIDYLELDVSGRTAPDQ